MKKLIAFVLSLAMAVSAYPLSAFAEEGAASAEVHQDANFNCDTNLDFLEEVEKSMLYRRGIELEKMVHPSSVLSSSSRQGYMPLHGNRPTMPSVGNVKILVIPIQFPDYLAADSPEAKNAFENAAELYFAPYDLSKSWKEQSVSAKLERHSHGRLRLSGTVLPMVTAPETTDYYDDREKYQNFLWSVLLEYADRELFDPSDYDYDGDGYLDGVAFWQSYTPATEDSGVTFSFSGPNREFKFPCGIRGGMYFQTTCWDGEDVKGDVHEIAHMMGIGVDTYKRSQNYLDDGVMDVMNCYDGYFNMYWKILLGWIDPLIITAKDGMQEIDLSAIDPWIDDPAEGEKAIILIPDAAMFPFCEYYIAEFRAGGGQFERPDYAGKGMVIWHVGSFLSSDLKYGPGKTPQYIKNKEFLKPVAVNGRGIVSIWDEYAWREGDVFSADSTPLNSKFTHGERTGAYLEMISMDADTPGEKKATIRVGFQDPYNGPVPEIEFSSWSVPAIRAGQSSDLEIYFRLGDKEIQSKNITQIFGGRDHAPYLRQMWYP